MYVAVVQWGLAGNQTYSIQEIIPADINLSDNIPRNPR